MAQLKISYFDVNGGRAEPIRLALHLAGINFEDHRFPFSDFAQEREQTPLGQVPILTLDGKKITQSNAILRYVGKQAELYPSDIYQALLCDEILDAAEDCINKIVATFPLTGDYLKTARDNLITGDLTKYLRFIESKLIEQGGEYFVAQKLSIADLKIVPIVGWINSAMLEHIPTDLVAKVAPKLNEHLTRISSLPAIKSYYEKR
ncbi:glutathione S-transferase [Thalassotalea agariperforans]